MNDNDTWGMYSKFDQYDMAIIIDIMLFYCDVISIAYCDLIELFKKIVDDFISKSEEKMGRRDQKEIEMETRKNVYSILSFKVFNMIAIILVLIDPYQQVHPLLWFIAIMDIISLLGIWFIPVLKIDEIKEVANEDHHGCIQKLK